MTHVSVLLLFSIHWHLVFRASSYQTMLNLIQKKLQSRMVSSDLLIRPTAFCKPQGWWPACWVPWLWLSQCDQVMEFSWSALWNITDETPDNCQMFLNCRGMSLFLECLEVSVFSFPFFISLSCLLTAPFPPTCNGYRSDMHISIWTVESISTKYELVGMLKVGSWNPKNNLTTSVGVSLYTA